MKIIMWFTDQEGRKYIAFVTSTVIPVLVPVIHLQNTLVQASLLQASVDQPAHVYCGKKENATSDVISPKLVTWFTDRQFFLHIATAFFTTYVYSDTSPGFVVGSGVCGWAEYCAFVCLSITKERDNWRAGHVTRRPTIASKNISKYFPATVKSTNKTCA